MFAAQRREQIMALLKEQKQVIVKELAVRFGVSEGTLRTDLRVMEEEGLLERTHGGAVMPRTQMHDSGYASRSELNHEEKRAIARAASAFVHQGQCIMLDASSTALELAKLLVDYDFLTVVTNGLESAIELNRNPRINVILIGGVLRPSSRTVEGLLGRSILEEVHADYFFTSAEAFHAEAGMTDFSLYEAELKKRMAANAAKVCAMVDHTKLNRRSIATSVQVSGLDMLITDRLADRRLLESLHHLQIVVAD
ncbi:transcriptional regulator [Paenibacillus sambharensis]|uniref:Transcriptional regulator n=1 Tax=Paenibacillus sambharensis TaxID=1803190 RepID=A0A2W1L5C7_9BACL|nr:DeoR/GlpR family DNA-binding transcription regulator [Paenibacillus sambharensis]PZD94133.1 transcriptional regulator [Paenibacillus sambharensis]